MSSLREPTDALLAALSAAQEQRGQRPNLVDGPDGPECEWAAFERATMHKAVNAARSENGLSPAPIEAIINAELQAVGHSDYSRKFAYFCAELVSQ
ncbi:hypothetical protein [Streptomyces sp. NBC_01708]|uniref:hypothetical protein n=1 Tax=Streptomyces sp. NBC_01708 TaxID=2975915 RepID=UPI002E350DCE|nr:hypothetical protein [Streptomyces sp. NBC_01708]